MFGYCRFVYILGALLCQVYLIYGCLDATENNTISDYYNVLGSYVHHNCWTIANPERNQLHIQFEELNLMDRLAEAGNLTLNFKEYKTLTYWSQSVLEDINTTSSFIQVDFIVDAAKFPNGYEANFTIHLATSIFKTRGVAEAISTEVAWIISKRTSNWGWHEITPRIVSALYLAGYAKFDGTNLEEELMAKEIKLRTSVALLKNSLSSEYLSMLINGLLVTCHNPRLFFGQNLIERLEEEIESPNNFTHPLAYLSLCNANESWPNTAEEDLNKILSNNNSFYEFLKDYQAIAVMAFSCHESQTKFLSNGANSKIKTIYEEAIQRFKQMQLPDGSFGNLHTTSFITQALISSGQEKATDWNIDAAIQYLIQQLTMPHDQLASYLVLPALNAKSLSDIAKVNCSSNPKRRGYDNFISDVSYYDGPKMRVQYSLYMGDHKDVIHTISLRVPANYTAYEVMELAASEDYKFRFKHKAMYVYQIGEVTNDSEAGLFWFLYKGLNTADTAMNTADNIKILNIGPDEVVMQDKEHLVMWYKKATF